MTDETLNQKGKTHLVASQCNYFIGKVNGEPKENDKILNNVEFPVFVSTSVLRITMLQPGTNWSFFIGPVLSLSGTPPREGFYSTQCSVFV